MLKLFKRKSPPAGRLIAYTTNGSGAIIRPAPRTREWMDSTPLRFANRCLPLLMANAHSWEVLSGSTIEATWNGGERIEDIDVRQIGDGDAPGTSHFGSGVLTFHTGHLFRTEPGYNLWVTGPINRPKHGIYALSGLIETDWSPYTFTMNWLFTAPGVTVRFEKGEPICSLFVVPRDLIESIEPELRSLNTDPDAKRDFTKWSEMRNAFNRDLHVPGSEAAARKWQKNYQQGLFPDSKRKAPQHQTKLRLKPFKQTRNVQDAHTSVSRHLPSPSTDSGKLKADIASLQKEITDAPLNTDARRRLAELYLEAGRPEKALSVLEKSQELNRNVALSRKGLPATLTVFAALCDLALKTGDLDDAAHWLSKAEEIDANAEYVLQLSGETAYMHNDFARSEKKYRQLIEQGVQDGPLLPAIGLARALVYLGELEEAIKSLDDILTHKPDHVGALFHRALAAFRAEDYQRTETLIQKAIAHAPTYAPNLLLLGAAQYALGDLVSAESNLKRFVEGNPEHWPAENLLQAVRNLRAIQLSGDETKPSVNKDLLKNLYNFKSR